MTNGFEYATALFTNTLFNGTGETAVVNPPADPIASFGGWKYVDDDAPFSNGSVATNRDIVVYATIAAEPEGVDYRVMITAITVDPVTMDVTLAWDVTPFEAGSVEIGKTKILYSDTLSDPVYTVSQWMNLCASTRVVGDVTLSVATANVTHAGVILGDYLSFLRGGMLVPLRTTGSDNCGFFTVIVNGVLKE